MPGISHLVFGLMLVIPFMYLAKDRFNYKVAIIFVLNNWVGPDSYWAWRFIPFDMHALTGFLIWAIPLSLFYSYLSRFSVAKTERFFTVVDDEKRDVKWKNAYLLCIGGGTFHIFIDTLFHGPPYGIDLFPEGSSWGFNLGDVNNWGFIDYGYSEVLIIVGFVAMIAASLLIIHYLRRDLKVVLIFLAALIGFVILSQVTLGWQTFTERELSATVYTLFFIFLPLLAFAYVMKDVHDHPTEPSAPLMNKERALKIVAIIALILGGFFLFLGISPFVAPSVPLALLGGYLPFDALVIVGIVITVLASIGVIGAIGLFFKINLCRYFVMFISILLWFFVFPFAILLFLCRKDIKEIFVKEGDNP